MKKQKNFLKKFIRRYLSSSSSFFYNLHPYPKCLPYNINWDKNESFWSKILGNEKIQVIDVGARDFSLEELQSLKKSIDLICFEAEKDEAHRLQSKLNTDFHRVRVFGLFIGKTDMKEKEFYLYKRLAESSSFEPSQNYVDEFDTDLAIGEKISVNETTLENIALKNSLNPDLIKLDTQGSELDILIGSKEVINECLIIETEVEFMEMYAGQPLFHDISSFLYDRDFQLLYLNRVFKSRNVPNIGDTRGQIVFGDALFGLSFEKAKKLSNSKKFKYCCLLINYGIIDFAYKLFFSDKNLKEEYPELNFYFKKLEFNQRGIFGAIKRLTKLAISGLIGISFIFIHKIIKTNGIIMDSDRSWNIR